MKVKVPLWRTSPTQTVTIDPAATVGAQFGVNLFDPAGNLVPWPMDTSAPGTTTGPSNAPTTTDELDEGQFNLYFTTARAAAAAPIQALVAGSGVAIDVTNPKHPVISATGGAADGHYDGGNAASVYTLAQHTFNGGAANG